jgi:c-di-GMP-binding flagellar brake protein YcgR
MTSVPGVDHPEEHSEAVVELSGRGIFVSSRVEAVDAAFIAVSPLTGKAAEQVVVRGGDAVEILWNGMDTQRVVPAEVTDVEESPVVRWRMRITGPAQPRQRREAVRGRIAVAVEAVCGEIVLTGRTVDLSEGGLRAEFEGTSAPPEADAELMLTLHLEDAVLRTPATVVRTQARRDRWVMSIRFLALPEKDQDRVRRRVFRALREERARKPHVARPDARG